MFNACDIGHHETFDPHSHRHRRQLELLGAVVFVRRRNSEPHSSVQQPCSGEWGRRLLGTPAGVHRVLNPLQWKLHTKKSEGQRNTNCWHGIHINFVEPLSVYS